MLRELKLALLTELVKDATPEELIWINGYFSGLTSTKENTNETPVAQPSSLKITIAYGTETGNSKKLAQLFAAKAKKKNVQAKVIALDQYRLTDLEKENYFVLVLSTHGDGEPPLAAKKFYDYIHSHEGSLSKLKYAVLALGDSAYPLFCKAGEDADQRLAKLGGQRITQVQKCDTDFEAESEVWFEQLLSTLTSNVTNSQPAAVISSPVKKSPGKTIFTGEIIANINLNDRGSSKQTHHIEIAAPEFSYQPGDAIGIVPVNSKQVVKHIFDLLPVQPDLVFFHNDRSIPAFDLLQQKFNITCLHERVVSRYAEITGNDIPAVKMHLADLLSIYPLENLLQFEELLEILEPIAPRLYSIASSPLAHEGEVHLTVAKDKYTVGEELRYGLCSDYLSSFNEGNKFQFYLHKNNQFKLPAEDKDVIMIGPGTGIAPFRSFLAERDAAGAPGRNWLFFGDQHFTTDFLYQSELQNWLATGVLTNLDLAFSRDQEEKIYVQHKLQKQAAQLTGWIQNGAYLYVCGARRMSEDVEQTLSAILGESILHELKENGRYLKDVY